jgi:hypothetical protein
MPDIHPDNLTITVNGKEQELFMSFSLQNSLARVVGKLGNLGEGLANPDMRDALVLITLAARNTDGKSLGDLSMRDYDISVAEGEKLLDWVMGHIVNFFLQSLEAAIRLEDSHEPRLEKIRECLTSLLSGLPAAPGTPAARAPN